MRTRTHTACVLLRANGVLYLDCNLSKISDCITDSGCGAMADQTFDPAAVPAVSAANLPLETETEDHMEDDDGPDYELA